MPSTKKGKQAKSKYYYEYRSVMDGTLLSRDFALLQPDNAFKIRRKRDTLRSDIKKIFESGVRDKWILNEIKKLVYGEK